MGLGPHNGSGEEEAPRPTQFSDLTRICRELNRLGAGYVVIGGFAMIHHGFPRLTYDIDLLIETTPENEARLIEAEEPVTGWVKRLRAWWLRLRPEP